MSVDKLLDGREKLYNQYQGYDVEILQFNNQRLEKAKCGSMACVAMRL